MKSLDFSQKTAKLQLVVVRKNGVIEVVDVQKLSEVKLGKTDKLRLLKQKTAETTYEDLVVLKNGEDLEIVYGDGTTLAIKDFYILENISLELPTAEYEMHILSSNLEAGALSVVYAQGDMSYFSELYASNGTVLKALNGYSDDRGLNAGAEVAAAGAAEAGTGAAAAGGAAVAGGMSTMAMVGLGALAVGGVAVAAGGGGGGGSSAPAAPAADTTAPVFQGVVAHSADKTLVLTYSEALDATNIPATTDFTITTGGSANPVTAVVVSGNTITLTLANSFGAGDAVSVTYTDPTGSNDANAIQDAAGNDAVTLSISSGVVADGYIRGAQVWIDTNGDGVEDYNTGVVTDADGNFFLPPNTPSGSIVAIGGVNIDTGVPNTMPLRAPEGSTVINPLTTLVQAIIEANSGMTAAQASAVIVEALGLTNGTVLTTFDPIAENDLGAQQAAATVATVISLASDSSADTTAILTNMVEEIQTAATNNTTLDFTDSTTLANIVENVTITAEELSAVSDAAQTIEEATDLSEITEAQSEALDTTAVSASTIVATAVTADTTPAIRVNLNVTSTDGTAAVAGDTVSLKADGVQLATATLSALDIARGYVTITSPTLADGTYALSAVVVDQAGNIGAAYPSVNITIDTTPTTPSVINRVTSDDVINLAEKTAGVTLTGTIDAGSTVTVEGNAATVSGTSWSYTLTAGDYTAMGEGAETIDVVVTAANSTQATSTRNITIDTVAPTTLTINDVASDNAISASEESAGVTITGTAEADSVVTLTIGVNAYNITATGGNWSHTLSEADYTAIGSGLTISAVAKDAAGNSTSPVTKAITLDTTAPLLTPVTLATASDTGVLSDGKGNDATPDFTFTAESGATLEMKVGAGSFANVGTGTGAAQTITATTMSEGNNAVVLRATDVAGNTTERTLNYKLDTTAPTATITMADSALKIGDTSVVTITFSEAVTNFANADVTVENGTLSTLSSSDGGVTWTATFTPSSTIEDTTNVISLANTYTDTAGNAGTVATSANYAIDTTAPTATITMADSALKIGETSVVTITFSEAVADFANADVTVENGTLSTLSSSDGGVTWTATFTPSSTIEDTTNVISLANTYTDVAGNAGTVATSANYAIDTTAPTATITMADSALKIGETSLVTIVFSEAVADFANADVTVENGTLGTLSSSDGGVTWTATFTPSSTIEDTTNVISLANTYTDVAGNTGTVATSANYTVDTVAPTVTITDDQSDTANIAGGDIIYTFTFSEAVTGFSIDDVTVANGTKGTFTATSSTVYTLVVTPTAGFTGNVTVDVAQNIATDTAGNNNTVATQSVQAVDMLAPTVAISAISGGFVNDAEDESVVAVSGTTVGVEDGQTVTVTINSVNYTSTVASNAWTLNVPSANIKALTEGTINVVANVSDAAGNPATQATQSFVYDIVAPTVTSAATATAGENTTAVVYTATATADGNGAYTYSLSGTDSALFNINSTTGEVTFVTAPDYENPANGNTDNVYDFTVTATDAAGNQATQAVAITVNNIDVTVGDVTADNIINAAEKAAGVTITGNNEPSVTVTVNGQNATVTGTSWSYTLDAAAITAMGEGAETLTIVSGGTTIAKDITVDTVAPTVAITSATLTNDATPVVSGTAENGATITAVIAGATYTTTATSGTWSIDTQSATPTSGTLAINANGNNSVSVTATDAAGNTSAAVTQTVVVDTTMTAPTFALATDTGNVGDNITSDTTINVTLASDVASWEYSVDGGTNWTTGTGTSFELIEGTYTVNAIQVKQTDTAGNISTAATNAAQIVVDTTLAAPTFALATDTGWAGDKNTSDGTVNVTLASDVTSWEYSVNGGTNWTTGTGTSFELAEGTYGSYMVKVRQTDTAGNVAEASNMTTAIIIDKTALALTYTLSNGTVTISGLEAAATWESSVDGGSNWTAGSGTTFSVGTSGTVNFAIRQTDIAGNTSAVTNGVSVNGEAFANTAPQLANLNWIDTDNSGSGDTNVMFVATEKQLNIDLKNYLQDAEGDTLTITVNSSTLPSGLSITTAGVISGTTMDEAANGTITFTVNDSTNSTQFTIGIKAASVNPFTQVDGAVDSSWTTPLVSGTSEFFEIDENGYFVHITNNNGAGAYTEYEDGSLDYTENIAFSDSGNNSGGVIDRITSGWGEEDMVFANARAVTSINGVATTGLYAVDVTFTVASQATVQTAGWWESDYTYWNGSSSVLPTTLAELRDSVFLGSNSDSVWINDSLHVGLDGIDGATSGTLSAMEWDGTLWYDEQTGMTSHHLVPTGQVTGGSWSITTIDSTEYLLITVPNEGTTAFKLYNGIIMQAEMPAVGYSESETLYYGVDLTTFGTLAEDILYTIAPPPPPPTDTTAPTIDATAPIYAVDSNGDSAYSANDTIYIKFSEPVAADNIALANLTLSGGSDTFGTGALITPQNSVNGYTTTFAITLGSDPVLTTGATITVASALDAVGNEATDLAFIIPSAPSLNHAPYLTNMDYIDTNGDDQNDSPQLKIASGEAISIDLDNYLEDLDGDSISSISIDTANIPSGLSYDAATHILSGTTTQGGSVAVTLTDSRGAVGMYTLYIEPIDMSSDDLSIENGSAISGFTTSAVFSANGFFGVDMEEGYFENITASGMNATVNEYEFDGDLDVDYTETDITFADSNGDGVVDSVTSGWATESIAFVNARAVTSINGVTTTGLNAVDVTFTVTEPKTVETTTDWDDTNYTMWNGEQSVPVTDLNTLEEMFTTNTWATVWMEHNTYEQVKLLSDGTVVSMVEDGSVRSWTDENGDTHYEMGVIPTATVVGSWTNTDGMLTVTVGSAVTAFKVESSAIMRVELPAVGYTETDTWYYGVDLTTFAGLVEQIGATMQPPIGQESFESDALLSADFADNITPQDITEFPNGTILTDGYAVVNFTSTTTATVTVEQSTYDLTLSGGVASITMDGTTYTYKVLAADGEAIVLVQTSGSSLIDRMTSEQDGPPTVWTLAPLATYTADELPTSGTRELHTTEDEDYGQDRVYSITEYGTTSATSTAYNINGEVIGSMPLTITDTELRSAWSNGGVNFTFSRELITTITNGNGTFYVFDETRTDTANMAEHTAYDQSTITGWLDYLIANSLTLWADDEGALQKDAGTGEYSFVHTDLDGDALFTIDGNGVLKITWSEYEYETFAINGTKILNYNYDRSVVTESSNSIYDVEFGINLTVTDNISIDLSELNYADNLYSLDADNGVVNAITLTEADVLATGVNDTLYLDVDANDTLDVSSWTAGSNETFDGKVYATYTSNSATLYVNIDDAAPVVP